MRNGPKVLMTSWIICGIIDIIIMTVKHEDFRGIILIPAILTGLYGIYRWGEH